MNAIVQLGAEGMQANSCAIPNTSQSNEKEQSFFGALMSADSTSAGLPQYLCASGEKVTASKDSANSKRHADKKRTAQDENGDASSTQSAYATTSSDVTPKNVKTTSDHEDLALASQAGSDYQDQATAPEYLQAAGVLLDSQCALTIAQQNVDCISQFVAKIVDSANTEISTSCSADDSVCALTNQALESIEKVLAGDSSANYLLSEVQSAEVQERSSLAASLTTQQISYSNVDTKEEQAPGDASESAHAFSRNDPSDNPVSLVNSSQTSSDDAAQLEIAKLVRQNESSADIEGIRNASASSALSTSWRSESINSGFHAATGVQLGSENADSVSSESAEQNGVQRSELAGIADQRAASQDSLTSLVQNAEKPAAEKNASSTHGHQENEMSALGNSEETVSQGFYAQVQNQSANSNEVAKSASDMQQTASLSSDNANMMDNDAGCQVNSAVLIQRASQSEMHVGLTSSEFGRISISAASTRNLVSAQISVNHSELASTLASHVNEFKSDRSVQPIDVRIDMRDASMNLGAGSGNQQNSDANSRGRESQENRRQAEINAVNSDVRILSAGMMPSVAISGNQAVSDRLDVSV